MISSREMLIKSDICQIYPKSIQNCQVQLQRNNNCVLHRNLISRPPGFIFFSMWIVFYEHSRFSGQVKIISLFPLYHIHPLNKHLEISRAITAENSPLHLASSRTGTGNLWFTSANRYP